MSDATPPIPCWSRQDGFDVRLDWGIAGIERLAPVVTTVVIVDVLRFTTAVETAVASGVSVMPHRWKDASAAAVAAGHGALVADGRGGPSLSPLSLRALPAGARVVLPSPNGAACALAAAAQGRTVLASCLRNAAAVAGHLHARSGPVGVIACGELWTDGSLRPALEDELGAGALIARMQGRLSPEAEGARASHAAASVRLEETLRECASGRELRERLRSEDVAWASEQDVSDVVPVLRDGWFVRA